MQGNNRGNKKKKSVPGAQQTLFGGIAFDPLKDCVVCKGRAVGRVVHRAHHKLCHNNRRTLGVTSAVTLSTMEEERRLNKLFAAPLQASEKGSAKNLTSDNVTAFFAPRATAPTASTTTIGPSQKLPPASASCSIQFSPTDLHNSVVDKVNNNSFVKEHRNNRAPLAMIALASVVRGSAFFRNLRAISKILKCWRFSR